ncbi:MAG: YceI family protein [Lautropia sp.]|nr:YceI family protein [Lautropia sp.]
MMNKLGKLSAISLLAMVCSAPALAAPKTYVIDPSHSFANFSYSHMGLSEQESRFVKTAGTIVYDAAAKTGAVDVEIDTSSVDTGSSALDTHLKGPDFFDVAKYPKAVYKSTRVIFKGGKPVAAEGNLTIKDVTKPVTMKIDLFNAKEHPMKHKDALGAKAHLTIKRSDFGLSKFIPAVGDEVTITVRVEAAAS